MNDITFPPLPQATPDLKKYRSLLEDLQLTDEQADALLMELWGFMFRCVEAQFTLPSIPDIFAVLLQESSEPAADAVQSHQREDVIDAESEIGRG